MPNLVLPLPRFVAPEDDNRKHLGFCTPTHNPFQTATLLQILARAMTTCPQQPSENRARQLAQRGVGSVGAPVGEHVSLVGSDNVGVVSSIGARIALQTSATEEFRVINKKSNPYVAFFLLEVFYMKEAMHLGQVDCCGFV